MGIRKDTPEYIKNTKMLTSQEVADRFGVAIGTVRRWAHDGDLPAHRTLGGHLRFDSNDVAELLGRPSEVR